MIIPMQKVLVCGGAGFIGSHLVDKLTENNEVFVLDDLSGGRLENVNKKAKFFWVDMRDGLEVDHYVSRIRPDVVFALQANAAENKSHFSPIDISTRNYNTFLNLIVPAINCGVRRVIVTSSIAVYGSDQTPFREDTLPVPEDIYGISKLAVEQSLKTLAKMHGFEYIITRPHNVYGPRQNMSDPYRNVVTIFMNSLLAPEPYNIYGDGEQRRCFTYIDDVVRSLVRCVTCPKNMTFNIGSDKDYSVNELSNIIQKTAGTNIPPVMLKERQEVKVAVSDHNLARHYLEYKDSVTLEEGLKKTWNWCKNQGYQKPKYTELEIKSKKIPSNWNG